MANFCVADLQFCNGSVIACGSNEVIIIERIEFYSTQQNTDCSAYPCGKPRFGTPTYDMWNFTNKIFDRCSLSTTCNLSGKVLADQHSVWVVRTFYTGVHYSCIEGKFTVLYPNNIRAT